MSGRANYSAVKSYLDVDAVLASSFPVASGLTDQLLEFRQEIIDLDTETGPVYVNVRHVDPVQRDLALDEWLHKIELSRELELLRGDLASRKKKVVKVFFEPLQEWEGVVVSIANDGFLARLVDISAGDEVESEETTFSLSDLSESDKELLEVGAIFRWAIGYERSPSGSVSKKSSVVFRRLPIWTQEEIDHSVSIAESIKRSITWE